MSILYEANEVWLLVKTSSDSWIKVVPSLDDAVEEFVVCTKVKKESYIKILKITPNGSIDDILRSATLDKEQIWKRAFEIHDKIKNRLTLEKANEEMRDKK